MATDHGVERHEPAQNPESRVPGVVDTIGLGFTALVSRPWIVVGPVLLDLYLWLGWRVSAAPLTSRLASWLRQRDSSLDGIATLVAEQDRTNILELLSFRLPAIRFPTFLPLLVTDEPVRLDSWQPAWQIGASWLLVILGTLCFVMSFLIGAEYLLWLCAISRGEGHRLIPMATVKTAGQLALWLLIACGLILLVGLPIIAGQAALIAYGAGSSPLLALLLFLPVGLGFILFYFAAHSIAYDRIGAFRAFRSSYRVVRNYGWQSLGFIGATILVTNAFPFLWQQLLGSPAGTLLAFIGNSFIASGMFVSAFIFYRDRAQIVSPVLERE